MAEGTISFEELEATATPPASATPVDPPAAEPPAAAPPAVEDAKPQFTEADVESYRQLVELGITPQNAAEFKAAKQQLETLPQLLRSPDGRRQLLDEIQKHDPETYKGLLDYVSDRWFSELPSDAKTPSENGSPSRSANSTHTMPDPRVATLQTQLEGLIQERNQEKTARQQEAISTGYNSTIDSMLAKLPDSVSSRDKDYIRLKTNELIWKDDKARNSVAKGVYMDVPTYFSKASSLVTAETKAAANAEHDRRAGVEARGTREIPAAAENLNGSASSKQEGHGHDPIWGDISSSELKSAYK